MPARFLTLTLAMTGFAVIGIPDAVYFHEVWASLLIFTSLMTYRKDRWFFSVLLGVTACLFRELALPYLFAMGAFAIRDKRWGEVLGWSVAVIVFCLFFAMHLQFASRLYRPGDLISGGWLAIGGLPFVLASARWNIAFHPLPASVLVIALSIALIGLTASKDNRAWRAAFIATGYMTAFLIVGRPENDYWGILYTPLLPLGFIGAPNALHDLWSSAFGAQNGAMSKAISQRRGDY